VLDDRRYILDAPHIHGRSPLSSNLSILGSPG
jgi:hypothetical protein